MKLSRARLIRFLIRIAVIAGLVYLGVKISPWLAGGIAAVIVLGTLGIFYLLMLVIGGGSAGRAHGPTKPRPSKNLVATVLYLLLWK